MRPAGCAAVQAHRSPTRFGRQLQAKTHENEPRHLFEASLLPLPQ
jgi:hypothetical protein